MYVSNNVWKYYYKNGPTKISIEKKDNDRIRQFKTDMWVLLKKSFDKTPPEEDIIAYVLHPHANISFIPTEMITDKVIMNIKPKDFPDVERYKFTPDIIKKFVSIYGEEILSFIPK